jgi:hypothetical protein
LRAQHGKLDARLRTFALLGTPSVQSVHAYYPLYLEDGGRLASVATGLVDRMAILVVVRRCHGMGVADSRSLHFRIVMSACKISSVDLLLFLFDILGRCVARTYATSLLCSSLYFGFSYLRATLCKRAMLMLWRAFSFFGLTFFLVSSFYLVISTAFSYKNYNRFH